MTGAEQAKQRLQWCVAQRRNGGAWIEIGWRQISIKTSKDLGMTWGTMTFDAEANRYRWRYA